MFTQHKCAKPSSITQITQFKCLTVERAFPAYLIAHAINPRYIYICRNAQTNKTTPNICIFVCSTTQWFGINNYLALFSREVRKECKCCVRGVTVNQIRMKTAKKRIYRVQRSYTHSKTVHKMVIIHEDKLVCHRALIFQNE